MIFGLDQLETLTEGGTLVSSEESQNTFITKITLTKLLGLLESVDLRISQLTIFRTLKIDDHEVTLGILPSKVRESLTELGFLSHITVNNVTSIIIVLLEITLHEVFN